MADEKSRSNLPKAISIGSLAALFLKRVRACPAKFNGRSMRPSSTPTPRGLIKPCITSKCWRNSARRWAFCPKRTSARFCSAASTAFRTRKLRRRLVFRSVPWKSFCARNKALPGDHVQARVRRRAQRGGGYEQERELPYAPEYRREEFVLMTDETKVIRLRPADSAKQSPGLRTVLPSWIAGI